MSGSEAMHWLELSKVSMGQSMQQLHVGCWQGTGFQNLSIWLALVTTYHLDGFEESWESYRETKRDCLINEHDHFRKLNQWQDVD